MKPTKFGQKLRREREDNLITMKQVAEFLGISVSYVSDVEIGRRKPFKKEDIAKLCKKFKFDFEELQRLALIERGGVELSLDKPNQNGLAIALARTWDSLSEDQIAEINNILEGKNGKRGNV